MASWSKEEKNAPDLAALQNLAAELGKKVANHAEASSVVDRMVCAATLAAEFPSPRELEATINVLDRVAPESMPVFFKLCQASLLGQYAFGQLQTEHVTRDRGGALSKYLDELPARLAFVAALLSHLIPR